MALGGRSLDIALRHGLTDTVRECPLANAALPLLLGLFGAVTALRWFLYGSGQAAALLYVVPIALSALWFGRRGGVGAAAGGAALFVVLAVVHGRGDLDATGWADPLVAMVLVGGLVGALSERAARARGFATRHALRTRRLEELCQRQRDALLASDSLVQTVAAARWMLEAGRTEEAVEVLTGSVADGIARLRAVLDGNDTAAPGRPTAGRVGVRGVSGSVADRDRALADPPDPGDHGEHVPAIS